MKLYPGTEHLLVPVACGDAFLDIKIAVGDGMVEAMLHQEFVEPTFRIPSDPEENLFSYSFPVANQAVKVMQYGNFPERKRLICALLACGAVRVTYIAERVFDFYPETFDDLYFKGTPARRDEGENADSRWACR